MVQLDAPNLILKFAKTQLQNSYYLQVAQALSQSQRPDDIYLYYEDNDNDNAEQNEV
jgi:hypothetical protein